MTNYENQLNENNTSIALILFYVADQFCLFFFIYLLFFLFFFPFCSQLAEVHIDASQWFIRFSRRQFANIYIQMDLFITSSSDIT